MLETADSMSQEKQAAAQAEQALEERKQNDRKELETLKVLTPKVMLKMGPKELQEAPEGFQYFAHYVDAMQRQAQDAAQSGVTPRNPAPPASSPFSGMLPASADSGGPASEVGPV